MGISRIKTTEDRNYFILWVTWLVILLVRLIGFVCTFAYVKGDSMYPTLENGMFYEKTMYINDVNDLNIGDIVTFKVNDKFFVKRVIGLPQDKIEFVDIGDKVCLAVNDTFINEKELWDLEIVNKYEHPTETIKVSNDCIYVLGDNREYSTDSRDLGEIPQESLQYKLSTKPVKKIHYISVLSLIFILLIIQLCDFLNLA